MALPNHNTNINHNVNYRKSADDLLHGIWHKLNRPTFFHSFTLCTAGGDPVIAVMTINNKTGIPISTAYFNPDSTPYVGVPADLVNCA